MGEELLLDVTREFDGKNIQIQFLCSTGWVSARHELDNSPVYSDCVNRSA